MLRNNNISDKIIKPSAFIAGGLVFVIYFEGYGEGSVAAFGEVIAALFMDCYTKNKEHKKPKI